MTTLRNRRLRCFYTDKIRPYLPDSEVRKLAHKKYKEWAIQRMSREDQEETPLHGVHIFEGLYRDQRPGAVSKCQLRKIVKKESQQKTKEQLLLERWNKAKIEIVERFAREGNAQFIREVKNVERSRKRTRKARKGTKGCTTQTRATCPPNTCPAIG